MPFSSFQNMELVSYRVLCRKLKGFTNDCRIFPRNGNACCIETHDGHRRLFRSVHDEEDREAEAGGSTNPNPNQNPVSWSTPGYVTPTVSPTTEGPAKGAGGLGLSSEDGWTVPSGQPRFERVDSSGSLTG